MTSARKQRRIAELHKQNMDCSLLLDARDAGSGDLEGVMFDGVLWHFCRGGRREGLYFVPVMGSSEIRLFGKEIYVRGRGVVTSEGEVLTNPIIISRTNADMTARKKGYISEYGLTEQYQNPRENFPEKVMRISR